MNIKDLLGDAYKAGMSLEDIENALEGIELPKDNSADIKRLEAALSKSNSEAADYKRQLREKMSAEDKEFEELKERFEELQGKYNTLSKESDISKNKARLLALGYEDALATETAEAMFNGEVDKVFAAQKKHLDSVEKKIREDVLKDTPRPAGGKGNNTITKEQFSKWSLSEQLKFSQEHPEEYKELYGGK